MCVCVCVGLPARAIRFCPPNPLASGCATKSGGKNCGVDANRSEWSYILVIIFKYSRALRAALNCATFLVLPDPWQTATGNVDSCTKHWK